MDPIALLDRIRELTRALLDEHSGRSGADDAELGYDLARLVQELDEWRRKGGFDPWARAALVEDLDAENRP